MPYFNYIGDLYLKLREIFNIFNPSSSKILGSNALALDQRKMLNYHNTIMAKLPILTYPAKSLKMASKPVEKVTSQITDMVHDMFETMYAAQGIGLAAPQVGVNLNILVMDVQRKDPVDAEKVVNTPICLINPKILSAEGTIYYEEGCLSCPELLVEVERSRDIVVAGLDAEGRPIELKLSELEAICTQHEMDHLKGKLLTDYISRLKRELYRKDRIRERKSEDETGDL